MQDYLKILNDEQRAAVVHEGSSLLILAGAGSGKTRVITTKIAYLIGQKNVDPWSILSVTFTKKAANEMKERAIALEPLSSQSQIRTFHSFGSWFLRKYSEAAGLESSFTVYDDNVSIVCESKIWRNTSCLRKSMISTSSRSMAAPVKWSIKRRTENG